MIVAIVHTGSGTIDVEDFRVADSTAEAVTEFCVMPPLNPNDYNGFDTGWQSYQDPGEDKIWQWDYDGQPPGLVAVDAPPAACDSVILIDRDSEPAVSESGTLKLSYWSETMVHPGLVVSANGGANELIPGGFFNVLQTADANPATLLSFALGDEAVYKFQARGLARSTDGTIRAMFRRSVGMYREGGGATLEGTVQDDFTRKSDAGLDFTLDASGNNMRIRVTGKDQTDVDWACWVRVIKIKAS